MAARAPSGHLDAMAMAESARNAPPLDRVSVTGRGGLLQGRPVLDHRWCGVVLEKESEAGGRWQEKAKRKEMPRWKVAKETPGYSIKVQRRPTGANTAEACLDTFKLLLFASTSGLEQHGVILFNSSILISSVQPRTSLTPPVVVSSPGLECRS